MENPEDLTYQQLRTLGRKHGIKVLKRDKLLAAITLKLGKVIKTSKTSSTSSSSTDQASPNVELAAGMPSKLQSSHVKKDEEESLKPEQPMKHKRKRRDTFSFSPKHEQLDGTPTVTPAQIPAVNGPNEAKDKLKLPSSKGGIKVKTAVLKLNAGSNARVTRAQSLAPKEKTSQSTESKMFSARKNPDFSRIHKREFAKMANLNDHIDNRKRRLDFLSSQKLKPRLDENVAKRLPMTKAGNPGTSKSTQPNETKFVPHVLSVRKLNLNFGGSAGSPVSFNAKGSIVEKKEKPVKGRGMATKYNTEERGVLKRQRKAMKGKGNNPADDSEFAIKGVRVNRRFILHMRSRKSSAL